MCAKFQITSELLDNYKPFSTVNAEKKMQAVCRGSFNSFYSIGDDDVLYLTTEKAGSASGWEKIRLSDSLAAFHGGTAPCIKTFAAVFDTKTQQHVIFAAAIQAEKDYLYLHIGKDVTVPNWKVIPIPDSLRKQFRVAELTVSSHRGTTTLIAEMVKPNGAIERYFIQSDAKEGELWSFAPLPANFTSIDCMVPGRAYEEDVDGIYSLGDNNGAPQLLYTPSRNVFDARLAPNSIRFQVPFRYDSIAACPVDPDSPFTHLFAAGKGKLLMYPLTQQEDMCNPMELVATTYLQEAAQMFAYECRGRIFVWVRNASKQLVCLSAPAGNFDEPGAWGPPLLIHEHLEYAHPFVNSHTGQRTIFGYTQGGGGVMGEESATNSDWAFTPLYVDDLNGKSVPVTSYTTKINVMDEHGNPLAHEKIFLRAAEPCCVLVNNSAYFFKENPLQVESDTSGSVKIIQKAASPSAISFEVWQNKDDVQKVEPSEHLMDRMLDLDSVEKLKNACVHTQNGKQTPLIPSGIKEDELKVTANAIATLSKAKENIDRVKMINSGIPLRDYCVADGNNRVEVQGIKISFLDGKAQTEDVPQLFDSMQELMSSPVFAMSDANESPCLLLECDGSFLDDFWGWVRGAIKGACEVVIAVVDHAWQFVVKIGNIVRSFIIDCFEAISACFVEIFRWIKIAAEKIIEFLKFLFDFSDIKRTKDVLLRIINATLNDIKSEMTQLKQETNKQIDRAIILIEKLADLKSLDGMEQKTPRQMQSSANSQKKSDVKSSYINDMLLENSGQISGGSDRGADMNEMVSIEVASMLERLKELVEQGKTVFKNVVKRIEKEFFENNAISDMDFLTILKKLAGIIAITTIDTARLIVNLLFDIIIKIYDLLVQALNDKIYIPVLSEFLELIGVGSFSWLDVACFATAFFVNFAYKLVTQKKLFDDATYNALIKINSLRDLNGAVKNAALSQGEDGMFEIPYNKTVRTLYIVFNSIAAGFCFIEAIARPICKFKKQTKGFIAAIPTIFLIGASLMSVAASIIYSPLGNKKIISSYIASAFSILKAIPQLFAFYTSVRSKSDLEKHITSIIADSISSVCAILIFVADIGVCIEAASAESGNEKTRFYCITAGNMTAQVNTVVDYALEYFIDEPTTRVAFFAVRTVLAVCVAGTFIAVAAIPMPEVDSANDDEDTIWLPWEPVPVTI